LVLNVVVALIPGVLAGQTADTHRSFSFDSRYVLQTYSNDAVAAFGIDVLNLSTLPTQLIVPSSKLRNAAQGVILIVGSTILGQAFGLAYHEYGHGTRAAAAGWRPRYGFGTISTAEELMDALQAPPEYESFLPYFLGSISNHSGYTLASPDDALFPPLSEEEVIENGWMVPLSAGGLNNQMLFTERIEDETYRSGGHIGFLTTYVNGKLAASQYDLGGVFGDVGNVARRYQAMGLDISEDQIDSASRASFFLSSLSYQLAYQTFRMFTGKSIRFTGWAPGGVELPNTSFFMTLSGLSYRVSTGYRTGAWRFPLAVENVFEGDGKTEISIGAERQFVHTYLRARVTVGVGIGVGLRADHRIRDKVALFAGYSLYDSRNLLGERLIPSLEHGSRYHDLFVGLSVAD